MSTTGDPVAEGAAMLDKINPGWEHKIDDRGLLMASSCNCILGQLYEDYYSAPEILRSRLPNGFTLYDFKMSWVDLKNLWIEEIVKRRAAKIQEKV